MSRGMYSYYAFISYSSKDTHWGKKIQKKLEHYRLPAALRNEHGWGRNPIKPVFFAPTDIQPGGLTEELQERLKASKNLIVICSPSSAQSKWVGMEIAYFHQLGRTKQIHFIIVDGVPHSGNPETECFNPVVESLGLPEILGANIHEKIYRWPWKNRERAYLQLISKLLGIEFDSIWQRHKRLLIQKACVCAIALLSVLAALFFVWSSNKPEDVDVRLNEVSVRNDALPPLTDAIITLTLDNEEKRDTIHSLDGLITFTNVPHCFIGGKVRMTVACPGYYDVDTLVTLSRHVVLDIHRDLSVYGDVHFKLWDPQNEVLLCNTEVTVAGIHATSDDQGHISLFVPLESQQPYYIVESSLQFVNDTLSMPSGPDDIIIKSD